MSDTFGRGYELVDPEPGPETQPGPVKLPLDFEVFFRQNKDAFFRIAVGRLHDSRDADEALSDAALVMYKKWERILAHPNPIAMAHRILDNKITDFYRRTARYAGREQSLTDRPDSSYLMEMRSVDKVDRALEELRRLAPQQAQCWEMHKVDGLAYAVIGKHLGISEGAAKTNASKGHKKMKGLIRDLPDMEKGDS
ncbi:RNA polymerase sigma factor [Streptomyces sp. NPDC058217]|uniref:RNA polymerase sigma factor n=1 Tax=Streptomyces sp. NPDC058217 TaxID=3346384 RepID=UPI0036F12B29